MNKSFILLHGKKVWLVFAILALTLAFAACNKRPKSFTDLNAVSTYLGKVKGGTLDKPIAMIINIPLGDMTNAGSGWQRLLMIIENAKKNVALDLSASQMVGTEFNPYPQVNNGKYYIISLALPTAARSIMGYRDTSSFQHFDNLHTVSSEEITSIGRNAFKDCAALISADFPVAANIAEGVFNGCTSLETVNLPLVTGIGNEAFNDCTSLISMAFPLVTSIGEGAFDNCTSMTSASFPASVTIVNNPFRGSKSLTCFTLNGIGDLGVIEDGKALVRNNTDLISYPSASGSIVMDTITTIGRSALNGCTDLSSVSFPAATNIGIRSFRSCTSLISASFPAATRIGQGVFENTGTTALTVTLGNRAPTVSDSMFTGVTGEKPVTVRVPAGATGYTTYWGNNFRAWNDKVEVTVEFMAEEETDSVNEEIVS